MGEPFEQPMLIADVLFDGIFSALNRQVERGFVGFCHDRIQVNARLHPGPEALVAAVVEVVQGALRAVEKRAVTTVQGHRENPPDVITLDLRVNDDNTLALVIGWPGPEGVA